MSQWVLPVRLITLRQGIGGFTHQARMKHSPQLVSLVSAFMPCNRLLLVRPLLVLTQDSSRARDVANEAHLYVALRSASNLGSAHSDSTGA